MDGQPRPAFDSGDPVFIEYSDGKTYAGQIVDIDWEEHYVQVQLCPLSAKLAGTLMVWRPMARVEKVKL